MPSPVLVPELSPLQLAEQLEVDDRVQVLDVRLPSAVAAGRVDLVPADRFHNVLASQIFRLGTLDGTGVDGALPIVVVCGHGNTSRQVTEHLNSLGYRACSLQGGMAAWMTMVMPRPLPAPPSLDRFVQFDRPGKGSLSYLLVSEGDALIVDPPRDAAPLVDAARKASARVVAVADTHVHADYISGAQALASRLGATYFLHPADATYPYDGTLGNLDFTPVQDGDAIRVGRSFVRVVHTPGHTEGSVCYVIDDVAALTGDFLFVASIGRPDLAGKTAEWTDALWQSVQKVRRAWPPDLMVYPAHYEPAARGEGGVVGALFADVQKTEALRAAVDRQAFAAWISARTGSFPEAYRTIKAVNVGLVTVSDQVAEELEVGRHQCAVGNR